MVLQVQLSHFLLGQEGVPPGWIWPELQLAMGHVPEWLLEEQVGLSATQSMMPMGQGDCAVLWLRAGQERKEPREIQPHSGGCCFMGSSSDHTALCGSAFSSPASGCLALPRPQDWYSQMSKKCSTAEPCSKPSPPDGMSCCLFTA